MSCTLNTALVARPSDTLVSRVFREFQPEGFTEKAWIVFEGDTIGKELFDEICEQVFYHIFENTESSSTSPVERFEHAMKQLNKKIDQEAILPEGFLINNSFVILICFESQIHFTTLGSAEVYFVRAGKVMHVSEGIAAKSTEDELFLNVASGEVQDGDRLIFSTLRILRYVTHTQLTEIAHQNAQDILHTLEDFVPEQEGGVIGAVEVKGAPALPFEQTIDNTVDSPLNKKGNSFLTTIKEKVGVFTSHPDIKKHTAKLTSKIPQEGIFLGIGVLVLLLIWSLITMFSGGIGTDTEKYKTLLDEIGAHVSTANIQINEGRTTEAVVTLSQAEIKAKDAFENSTFRGESQRYLKQIGEMNDRLSGTIRTTPVALVDISTDKPEEELEGVFLYDDEVYGFSDKNLFRVLERKIENIIPFQDEESIARGIPLEAAKQMVFLTARGNALLEVSKNVTSYAKTDDPASWKKGVDISFFSKNIYILSPENNEIYKYVRGTDTYSSPSSFNKDADVSDAISFAIDGNVYVLKKGGVVIKLLRGFKQEYELEAVPEGFSNVDLVYTLPELDLLLFMDKTAKRIYIFRKGEESAVFDRQIFLDIENEELTGMWFDVSANRVLVSGKTKIYPVALTQE